MKKLLFCAALMCAAMFSSCGDEYDDTALRKEMESIKDRVAALEEKLTQQVNALAALTTAVEEGLAVSVEETTDGYEVTIGEETFTIYNGKDGENGTNGTLITVVEVDGVYYWAINGEATEYPVTGNDGEDGKDGYTPEIKDGKWYINGEEVGPATGENGEDGDSFFKDVTVNDDDTVTFTLADDTTITVALAKSAKYTDVQSIKFVPEYEDGKITVSYYNGAEDAFVVAKYEVTPKAAAATIAKYAKDASMQAVYTKSRAEAGELVELPVTAIEAEEGIITVTATAADLAEEFFAGTLSASIRFAVQDDLSGNASEYVAAVAAKVTMPDFTATAVAEGYQAAKLTWTEIPGAAYYQIKVGEDVVAKAEGVTEFVVEKLTDTNKYAFTVAAYTAKDTELASADTEEVEIWTLYNWTEPEFELQVQSDGTYKFIAHNLANVNYAYGGAADTESGKSTIEIYKGEELLYTLTNTTGVATLNAWAGYKRWALNAQDDRKDWTWTGINNSEKEVSSVPVDWFEAGEYTIKYKIGYVVNKNGQWATNNGSFIPQAEKEGATHVYFANGISDVYCVDGNVATITKEGTSSKTIVVTQPIEASAVAQGYQGAKVSWTTTLTDVASWKVSAGEYTSDPIDGALTEFVVPETSLTKDNKYAFTVTAFNAENNALASNTTDQIQIWTLANRPEPVVTLENGVLTLANAEINQSATIKDNLHIYGAVLEAEIYFYRNNDNEPSHVAKGTYLDSYPGSNLPLSYEEKKLKNNIAGPYTAWKWDGAAEATKTVPEFEAGVYTVKYKAGYHTFVNASYGSDRLVLTAPSDALQTMVYREGTSDLTFEVKGTSLSATAVAEGFQGALVSWVAKDVNATSYEVYAGGKKVADAAADATSVQVTGLTDAQKYTFEVKAVGADLTATTEEIEIYTLCNWTEPEFELQPQEDGSYKFIAHKLINLNYAYGGAADTDSGKSTIEIYKGEELLYTLTNTTGQNTLTAWAGFGRWQLSAQDDRYEWTWTGVNNSTGEVKTVPAEWFTPGEYTIKYKIGYVVNKNGRWATANNESDVVASRDEATGTSSCVFFGPKDTKPSPNVLYTDESKTAVAVFTKEGTASFTVAAPASGIDLAGIYTKNYFEIDVDAKSGNSWTDGTYAENIPAFTTVTASTEEGPKWITNYNRFGLTLYFDVDSTEIADQPGCYALTNLIDRGPSNAWPDKIVDHGSHYNSNTGEIVFKFVIESSSAPGGSNGGTLEDNGVTVPGWAVGVTMTPAQ